MNYVFEQYGLHDTSQSQSQLHYCLHVIRVLLPTLLSNNIHFRIQKNRITENISA